MENKHRIKFILGTLALLFLGWFVFVKSAEATTKITICHKPGTQAQQTKRVTREAWNRPKGHKDHGDHKGACKALPTPTPTPAPICKWSEWSRCDVECGGGHRDRYLGGDGCSNEREQEKCFVKCEEPEPTPTPTPTPRPPAPNPITEAGANVCHDDAPANLPLNPLVWRKGGTAIVQWQPTGGDKANVYYFENQNPDNAHAVRDTENDGYVEIGELGGLDWTFGIQQSGGCAGGDIAWIVDGSTNGWVLFTQ